MRGQFIVPVLSLLILAPAHANERAQVLAASCTTCHARATGALPVLHGRPADEILQKLSAFRSGQTDATLMHQIVPAYSPEELRLIAEHFSRQP